MAGTAPLIPGCHDLSLIGERVARSLFAGTSDRLGRPVTVIAYPPLSEGRTEADFDRAAATAQRLGVHPSMISIHEWGHADDRRPWIMTDPQPAQALDTLLKLDGPLEVERALQFGILLAGALETAHTAGIVHGDLSPARLVFGPHGEPLLTETGLAPFAVFPGLGALNNPVRYYAPPEVLESTEITAATDVYALGTTVYALIAGRAPQEKPAEITDSNASLLLRVLQMAVPRIERPDLPSGLYEALLGPLAPDPRKRPQQAIEVAWLLQDVQRRAGFAITEPVVMDLDDIEHQRSRRAGSYPAPAAAPAPAPGPVAEPAPAPAPDAWGTWSGPVDFERPAAPATAPVEERASAGLWTPPPLPDDPPAPPTVFPFAVGGDAPPDGATLWPSSWPSGESEAELPAWARPPASPSTNGDSPVEDTAPAPTPERPTWPELAQALTEPPLPVPDEPAPPAMEDDATPTRPPWAPAAETQPAPADPLPRRRARNDMTPAAAEQPPWAPAADEKPAAQQPPWAPASNEATPAAAEQMPWAPAAEEKPAAAQPPPWAPPAEEKPAEAEPPPWAPAAEQQPPAADRLPRRLAANDTTTAAAGPPPWAPPVEEKPAAAQPPPWAPAAEEKPAVAQPPPWAPAAEDKRAAAQPPLWAPAAEEKAPAEEERPAWAQFPAPPAWAQQPQAPAEAEPPAANLPGWARARPAEGANGTDEGEPPWLPGAETSSSFAVPRPPELDVLPAWYTDPLPNGANGNGVAADSDRPLPGSGDELRSLFGAVVGDPPAAPPPPLPRRTPDHSAFAPDPLGPPTPRPPLDMRKLEDPFGAAAPPPPAPPAAKPGRATGGLERPLRLPRSEVEPEPPRIAPQAAERQAYPPPETPRMARAETAAPAPPPPTRTDRPRTPSRDGAKPPAAAGPPALPVIVLVVVLAVLVLGILYLVIAGDDSGTPADEPPPSASTSAPSGVTITTGTDGDQLSWQGDPSATYVVTVLSSTEPPRTLPPAPGTSAVVPIAGAPAGTQRCYTVATAPTPTGEDPGPASDVACPPGVSPDSMLPAP